MMSLRKQLQLLPDLPGYAVTVPWSLVNDLRLLGLLGHVQYSVRSLKMLKYAVKLPLPKPVARTGYGQQSIQNLINRDIHFRVMDDILKPDESKNHQVTQWQTGLGNVLTEFCKEVCN